jgi:hypothetical protein
MIQCPAFHIVVATIGVNERCVLAPKHEGPHRFMSTIPAIVCLCGSTKFKDAFLGANMEFTLKGQIVLSVGAYMHADKLLLAEEKIGLDLLHLRKIDLAHSVYVLNVGGYIGTSTARELAYCIFTGKPYRFLEPIAGEEFLSLNTHAMGSLLADFMNGLDLPDFRGYGLTQVPPTQQKSAGEDNGLSNQVESAK